MVICVCMHYDFAVCIVAYQPPVNVTAPMVLEVEMVVYDIHFLSSQPIIVTIEVAVSDTDAPVIAVNHGLTVIEGRARVIDSSSLQVTLFIV